MRKYLLPAVLAASALPAPAIAADQGFYVGVEGGLWLVEDIDADTDGSFVLPPIPFPAAEVDVPSGDNIAADLDTGLELGAVAGYDWGWVRTEAELSYKRAGFNEVGLGESLFFSGRRDADGYIRSFTVMANVLADVPLGGGWNLTAGPGFGWGRLKVHAKVDMEDDGGDTSKLNDESDSGWLWQLTGGIRKAVTGNVDLGLKYRYINTGKREYDTGFFGEAKGKLEAHSVLASLIYNFSSPAAAAPPPAVAAPPSVAVPPAGAPATQACPDGSIILAIESCPPPPAPEGERG